MAKRHVYTDIPVHKTQSFGKHEDSVRAGRQIHIQIQIQPPLPGRTYLCHLTSVPVQRACALATG